MSNTLCRCACIVLAAGLGCGSDPPATKLDAKEFQQKMKDLDREILQQEKKGRPTGQNTRTQ